MAFIDSFAIIDTRFLAGVMICMSRPTKFARAIAALSFDLTNPSNQAYKKRQP